MELAQDLAQTLGATLSSDAAQRSAAEQHLANLHGSPQCGLALISLVSGQSAAAVNSSDAGALHIRQAAALSLNKSIKERWSPYHNSFVGFQDPSMPGTPVGLPTDLKAPLRVALLQSLALPARPLRLAAANALCSAAAPDWPDDFPELLPFLRQVLVEGQSSPNSVHGCMAFLSDFVKSDLDENQIMTIAKELLVGLERVLLDESYALSLRARSILIFNSFLEVLFMVRESFADSVRAITADVLPRWLGMLEGLLRRDLAVAGPSPDATAWEELCLRSQAWSAVKLSTHFRAHFKSKASAFVELALSNMAALQGPFAHHYVSLAEDAPEPPTAAEGDNDIATTIPSLASSVIDFLAEALRGDRAKTVLLAPSSLSPSGATALEMLAHLLRSTCRMTRGDEEEWLADPSSFVAASEDEEGLGWSLRAACGDLMADLLDAYPVQTMGALSGAVAESSRQAQQAKGQGNADWWKEEEASLSIMGGVAEAVQDLLETHGGAQSLDLEGVFQRTVMPSLSENAPPFLLGRSFVFASQYCKLLPSGLSSQLLDTAVRAVEDESSGDSEGAVIVKLSAVRCIKNFHRHLSAEILRPFTGRIIARLGPLLGLAKGETLILLVEAIQAVAIDDESEPEQLGVPANVWGEIAAATIDVWSKEPADVILLSAVEDLLEALVGQKSRAKSLPVTQRVIPLLVSAATAGQADDAPEALTQAAIELLHSVLRGAKGEDLAATQAPSMIMPVLIDLLLRSDDRDVLSEGVHGLTALTRKVSEQVFAWDDANGRPAVESMVSVIAKLVSPSADTSESGGLAVGDLIVATLRKAPQQVLPVLPDLLKTLVARLVTAKLPSFTQSLILPIAYLIKDQADSVIALLSYPLDVSADSTFADAGVREMEALELLMRRWVENAETFQGFWAQRISALGLARILQMGLPQLEGVVVKGDEIPDTSNVIRTRSRSKKMPHQFTQVPLPAKILKVLVHEYEQSKSGAPGAASLRDDGARTPETDDEDGDWDDEDEPGAGKSKDMAFLSDLLGPGGLEGLDEDGLLSVAEDEDLKNEPVYNMDMKVWLASFFAEQAGRADVAQRLAPHLSQDESKLLQQALSTARP